MTVIPGHKNQRYLYLEKARGGCSLMLATLALATGCGEPAAGRPAPLKPVEVTETRRTPGAWGHRSEAGAQPGTQPSSQARGARRLLRDPQSTHARGFARLLLPAPPGAEVGQAGHPRARRARSVPLPPPLSGGFRGRGGASQLEGALAPRRGLSRCRGYLHLHGGERGRAGGREEEEEESDRREVGLRSPTARSARQAGTRARGFRETPEVG